MGKSNWICDQGELIFLRNQNRRIVMAAFWDAKNGKTIQFLEKNKKNKYKLLECIDDLIDENSTNIYNLSAFDTTFECYE